MVAARNAGRYENVLLSPLSISTVMAMMLTGARDRTASQIKDALGLTNFTDDTVSILLAGQLRSSKVSRYTLT